MVAHRVHADKELAHHGDQQVLSLAREGDLLGIVNVERAACLEERVLGRKPLRKRAAEIALPLTLVQAQAEELHHEAVAHMVALGETGLPHQRHFASLDALVVLAHGERVYEQRVIQEREPAAAQRRIFLIVHDVFVDHAVFGRVERPCAAHRERGVVALDQLFQDDAVETLLTLVAHLAHRARERALDCRRGREGVERRLVAMRLLDDFQVMAQHLLGLSREVIHHVHVQRGEHAAVRRLDDAPENLVGAAVLVVAVHLPEQVVVEALHAHRQALHDAVKLLDVFGDEVVGVGLAAHLADGEQAARKIDGLHELVDEDSRGATAHIERFEVVTERGDHLHLGTQVLEVAVSLLVFKREAVERTVRAQPLAKRNMQIEHVVLSRFGLRKLRTRRRLQVEIMTAQRADTHGEHSFSQHVPLPMRQTDR